MTRPSCLGMTEDRECIAGHSERCPQAAYDLGAQEAGSALEDMLAHPSFTGMEVRHSLDIKRPGIIVQVNTSVESAKIIATMVTPRADGSYESGGLRAALRALVQGFQSVTG